MSTNSRNKSRLATCAATMSAAALLTTAMTGIAVAETDPGRGEQEVVLELETHPTSHFQSPPGASKAGTLIGGVGGLTRFVGDREVDYGSDRWQCLYLEVAPDASRRVTQCNSTLDTPDGEITLQGAWTELQGPPEASEDAVTGGTGKYRNASGYAVYTLLNPEDPANSRYHISVHLSPARRS
ncbi:allene oxide cyclase barrel-like domain-containing protein [Streptomyces sp. NBC_01264]|uniref:allene oxide cyclase barrel-like domain-containing protein n=1 Tax=Streptomyces sp. NBC_01264 TaxID=2903804 RepID=UPI002253A587|nr:hypothetical protein [Streptomyces sp. NBC_01264]MCX4784218.1 dirigent protein [Streptomyces sp. NBC_01264]